MKDEKNTKEILNIIEYFPQRIKKQLLTLSTEQLNTLTEIRIKKCKALVLCFRNELIFVGENLSTTKQIENAVIVSELEFNEIFSKICRFSIYSYEDQIIKGYITIKGGHRVGIIGTAILSENKIVSIKDISSLNIRISREKIGAAKCIIDKIGSNIKSTLIISPPSGGKTTILRDLARELSVARKKVSIIDERGEIASVYDGATNKDIGDFTDVLDGYPKEIGIMTAIKSMSPNVILCDEISSKEDFDAVSGCFKNGVTIIATMHAESYEQLLKRDYIKKLIDIEIIQNVIELKGSDSPGEISRIIKTKNYKAGV
ncbi:MAG: stage III sporulation protein AA [Clostridia bacterium]